MKISRTGTLLALAAAAACALPASAQLDMDAASRTLAAIRQVRAQAPKAPKPKPAPQADAALPIAPEATWQKILDAIRAKGKFDAGRPPFVPANFGLEDVKGPKDGDHAAEYASAFGMLNDDEQFEAKLVTFVSETWTKAADGNWHIDQWIFGMDVYGEVKKVGHGQLVESDDHSVLSENEDSLAPGDPRVAAKFKSLLDLWSTPRP